MEMSAESIKSDLKDATAIEVWKYTDRYHQRHHIIHTDFIESADYQDIDSLPYDADGFIDVDVEVMDAERYDETILANSCLKFSELYNENDKVGVIVIR